MNENAFDVEQWQAIADGLYSFLGETAEIVVHDLRNLKHSVVYIKGHLTQRSIGDSATNIVLEALQANPPPNYVIADMHAVSGKLLKSLSMFVKDGHQIVGCICIIIDTTNFQLAINTLQTFLSNTNTEVIEQGLEMESISDISEKLIDATIHRLAMPVDLMRKEDKTDIVHSLEQQGIFLMKGSVELVAKKLNVSRYTIYNYLDEIKAGRI